MLHRKGFTLFCTISLMLCWHIHDVKGKKDWIDQLPNIAISGKELQSYLKTYRQIAVYFQQPVPNNIDIQLVRQFEADFKVISDALEYHKVKTAIVNCLTDYDNLYCNTKPTLQVFRRGKHYQSIPIREFKDTDAIVARLLHIYYDQVVPKIRSKEELNKLMQKNMEAKMDLFVGYFDRFYNRYHRMFFESFPTFKEMYKFVIVKNITILHDKLTNEMPLQYLYKVYHCNDTIEGARTCPHTYFNDYLSSHGLFLFMQRNKLPTYIELIHETNMTVYDIGEVSKVYIFAKSNQFDRVIDDVKDFGRDYSGKIGFLVANMSKLDKKAKLPVDWSSITKFPAVYAQLPGAKKKAHRMLEKYSGANLKFFVDEFWRRAGIAGVGEKRDVEVESIDTKKHNKIVDKQENETNYVIFYCPGPVSCEYWKVLLGRIKRSFITNPTYDIVTYQFKADLNNSRVPKETAVRFVSKKGKVDVMSSTIEFTYEGILDFVEEETDVDFTRLVPTAGDHFEAPMRLSRDTEKRKNTKIDDEIALDVRRIYEPGQVDVKDESKARSSTVPSLSDQTIDAFLSKAGLRIINFYSTWEIRSKAFSYSYEDLRNEVEKELARKFGISLAEINCADYPRPCESHNITNYPTIKFYRNNRGMVYKGMLTPSSLITALQLFAESAMNQVEFSSSMQGIEFIHNSELSIIGLFEEKNEAFDSVLEHFVGRVKYRVSYEKKVSNSLAKSLNVKLPAIMCVTNWHDVHRRYIYGGDLTVEAIKDFFHQKYLPVLGKLDQNTFINYVRSDKPLLGFVIHGEALDEFINKISPRMTTDIYSAVNVVWMDLDEQNTQDILYYYARGDSKIILRGIFIDRQKGIINMFRSEDAEPDLNKMEIWLNDSLHADEESIIKLGGLHLADRDWVPNQEAIDFVKLEKLDDLQRPFDQKSPDDILKYLAEKDIYDPQTPIADFGEDEGVIIDGVNIGPISQEAKDSVMEHNPLPSDGDQTQEAPSQQSTTTTEETATKKDEL